jgi:nucleoside-diphosphate-sugar epimerase
MKILVAGNMGYIGPLVVGQLRKSRPEASLIGFDIGYFAPCLTTSSVLPECRLDCQYFGDVRAFPPEILAGVEGVVYLAAISNDPMGNAYEAVTLDINYQAAVALAKKAKAAGVKSFVFASSCSVYGFAADGARHEQEQSPHDPLTAYARSKVQAERDLAPLADANFRVTCLRFATACGMSDRLRLDLVVNDFVASAVAAKKITILSDGTPWRPLIHVRDMARAIDWALGRPSQSGGDALVVNTGSDSWNYQVKNLAEAVAQIIPGIEVSINQVAPPDKRSYKVDFALFKKLAPNHQPQVDLSATIKELKSGLENMNFHDSEFRKSQLVRLNALSSLRNNNLLTPDLRWAKAA